MTKNNVNRQLCCGPQGFSLIELLVAMTITGILVVLLGQSMDRIMSNSAAIMNSLKYSDEMIALRKIFHRDVQNIADFNTFSVGKNGFSFVTTHNLLSDGPVPVNVDWDFSRAEVNRIEQVTELSYRKKNSYFTKNTELEFRNSCSKRR